MTYILVKDYLNRLERIKNGTASISDVQIINIRNYVLGRYINSKVVFDCGNRMKKIKVPDLVFKK